MRGLDYIHRPIQHQNSSQCVNPIAENSMANNSVPTNSVSNNSRENNKHYSDLEKLLLQRRSIKFFDVNCTIDDSEIDAILRSASHAPSAFNLQHWQVLHIKTAQLRAEISALAYQQPQILHATALLAVVMKKNAWACEQHIAQAGGDSVQAHLSQLYNTNPALARDEAMRSCAMYSMLVMLAAEAAGYRTCPMSGANFPAIAQQLGLDKDQEICMLITLGREATTNRLRPPQRLPLDQYRHRI